MSFVTMETQPSVLDENDASATNIKANLDDNKTDTLTQASRFRSWAGKMRRSDPRYEILQYFDDVAHEGAVQAGGVRFRKSSVFTVWRPTSVEAIRKMMLREGIGKGLDIKGKSAKQGLLSSFVPFLQIHQEDHKHLVRTPQPHECMDLYFRSQPLRETAIQTLELVLHEMLQKIHWANAILSDPGESASQTSQEEAKQSLAKWEMMDNPAVLCIDIDKDSLDENDETACNTENNPKECFGIQLPKRLFWECYVVRQDCSRGAPGSPYETGRPSEPAFQDMNFQAVGKQPKKKQPRAVVWQHCLENPMRPQTLLMAYQENGGRVVPVVSDFDCFIMGTRGVTYEEPLPEEQLQVMDWCISQCNQLLETPTTSDSWTRRWLDVLKENAMKGFHPEIPQFGFSDPTSYSIMEQAVDRLVGTNGAVRHGAECFNFYFPQELDQEFLVISETLLGPTTTAEGRTLSTTTPWKYMNVSELQETLCQKIDEGFTFPLNPKWVLCDDGWKKVYDKLLLSKAKNVQSSIDCWYPPNSGLRERIEDIYTQHPQGFQRAAGGDDTEFEGTEAMDLAELELTNFIDKFSIKQKLTKIVSGVSKVGQEARTTVVSAGKGVVSNMGGSVQSLHKKTSKGFVSSVRECVSLVGMAMRGIAKSAPPKMTNSMVTAGKGMTSSVRSVGKGLRQSIRPVKPKKGEND